MEITEAKRFSLEVPDADVDASYAEVATRMGIDAQKLTQILDSNGASADTLKRRLRAQIAWTNLVRGRYKASLEISDKDVEAQLQLHKPDEKNASATNTSCGPSSLSCRAARRTPFTKPANAMPKRCGSGL